MGKYDELKRNVYDANMLLHKYGLVIHTWGNVSQRSEDGKAFAIKPSGVAYNVLKSEDIVVVNLDGKVIEGSLVPSSDTPTHLHIYKSYPSVKGITHNHSANATAWAQYGKELPCFGTTHADYFYGAIPCTETLTKAEVEGDYETNTGKAIVTAFASAKTSPSATPAVLVKNHGPFVFSDASGRGSVDNALTLEEVAKIAVLSKSLDANLKPVANYVKEKHYNRKHGKNAYYGQKK